MGLFSDISATSFQNTEVSLTSDPSCSWSLIFHFLFLFQVKNNALSAHSPDDPFNDEERERLQVEALAKKFENKYVSYLLKSVFFKCFYLDYIKIIIVRFILEFFSQHKYCNLRNS